MGQHIADLLNRPKRSRGRSSSVLAASSEIFGIELEIEGIEYGEHEPPRGWEQVRDGSLRGGLELRFREPVPAPACVPMIEEALTWCKRLGGRCSIRTGLHVHVDMAGATQEGMRRLLAVYLFFEPQIMNLVGPEREVLMFCQPLSKTAHVLNNLIDACSAADRHAWSAAIPNNDLKYSGLNFASLPRIGTVEWRHRAMTLESKEVVRWLEIISAIHSVVDMETDAVDDLLRSGTATSIFGPNQCLFHNGGNLLLALVALRPQAAVSSVARDPETWERLPTSAAEAFLKRTKSKKAKKLVEEMPF